MSRVINLLPKPIQQNRKLELFLKSLKVFVVTSFALYGLAICGQLSVEIMLSSKLAQVKASVEHLQKTSSQEVSLATREEVKLVNTKIQDYRALSDATPLWSQFLREFTAVVPPGVRVNSVSVDYQSKKVRVSGVARERSDVLLFYDHLNTVPELFGQVNFPFENIIRDTQVPFTYTFVVQESVFKPKP